MHAGRGLPPGGGLYQAARPRGIAAGFGILRQPAHPPTIFQTSGLMSTPTESDRHLARRLGVLLDESRPPIDALDASNFEVDVSEDVSPEDRAFVQQLITYREAVLAGRPTLDASQSRRMWSEIEASIDASADAPAAERVGERADAPAEARAPADREDRAARPSRTRSRSRLPLRVQWAALAVLVLGAVGVTWFILQPDPLDTALVARAESQMRTIRTADGSTVRLRPNSTLYRVEVSNADRYRIDGEARFDVVPRSETPFEVDVGEARVRVLGTRFTVRTWTESPEVYLSEGVVAVTHTPSAQADTLQPGQRAVVSAGGSIDVATADSTGFVSWTERRLVLQQQPLARVVRELEQHYAIEIRVAERLRDQTLSGELALGDPETTLDDLGLVLGGSFERERADVYRFQPAE